MSTILDERTPMARKQHRCDSCGGSIRAGEIYRLQVATTTDGFGQYKAHFDCDEAERILFHYSGDEMTRVQDMGPEDRDTVRLDDPGLAARIWGEDK